MTCPDIRCLRLDNGGTSSPLLTRPFFANPTCDQSGSTCIFRLALESITFPIHSVMEYALKPT